MLYLPKKPRWPTTVSSIMENAWNSKSKNKVRPFSLFFVLLWQTLHGQYRRWEYREHSPHYIINHTQHPHRVSLGCFRLWDGGALVAPFRHFLHRRQILYHVSPGERPCELTPHALGTPQASTICIALNLVGHWSLTSGQGLRIIFAELKRRSHWVDVSIINQRRISPTQCLPCWEKGAHVSEASTSSHYFFQPSAPHCPPTVLTQRMTSSKNSKMPQNVQISTIMINIMLSLWSILYLSLPCMEKV